MQVIDGKWIASRLTGAYGEKARLAEAIGIEPFKLSRILKGEREVQASEIPAILRFFEIEIRITGAGFAEPGVEPFQSGASGQKLTEDFGSDLRHPSTFRVRRSLPAFFMKRDDLLLVDLHASPQPNDLVLVKVTDQVADETRTEVYRFAPPWLLPSDASEPMCRIDTSGNLAILGCVRACLRQRA